MKRMLSRLSGAKHTLSFAVIAGLAATAWVAGTNNGIAGQPNEVTCPGDDQPFDEVAESEISDFDISHWPEAFDCTTGDAMQPGLTDQRDGPQPPPINLGNAGGNPNSVIILANMLDQPVTFRYAITRNGVTVTRDRDVPAGRTLAIGILSNINQRNVSVTITSRTPGTMAMQLGFRNARFQWTVNGENRSGTLPFVYAGVVKAPEY